MKECDNSKIHKQQLHIVHKSSNNVWHLTTKAVTTLQHSATLHPTTLHCNTPLHFTQPQFTTLCYTSPHFTQLHFATLIDTSLPLICTSLHFHLALCWHSLGQLNEGSQDSWCLSRIEVDVSLLWVSHTITVSACVVDIWLAVVAVHIQPTLDAHHC
jgi:hypothetical protein